MKAHFVSSSEPLKSGETLEAACGAEVKNSFFAFQLDTAFTVGHTIGSIVSINTLLFCRKCLCSSLAGRYLYAICEGQDEKDAQSGS